LPSHCSFSLMLRPPTRPPLFPYTTLFRSRSVSDETTNAAEWATRWPLLSPEHREKAAKLAAMPGASIPSDATDDIIDILWAAVQDRKSTRLNSSHVKISYAVFCLKKKRHS